MYHDKIQAYSSNNFDKITQFILPLVGAHAELVRSGGHGSALAMGFSAPGIDHHLSPTISWALGLLQAILIFSDSFHSRHIDMVYTILSKQTIYIMIRGISFKTNPILVLSMFEL